MKSSICKSKIGFVYLLLMILSIAAAACEPLITIRVQNRTNEALQITVDNVFVGRVPPGGEVKHQEMVIFSIYVVVAKDVEGNVVYTTNFTREDISGKRTYRVVIPPTAGKGAEQSDNVTGND